MCEVKLMTPTQQWMPGLLTSTVKSPERETTFSFTGPNFTPPLDLAGEISVNEWVSMNNLLLTTSTVMGTRLSPLCSWWNERCGLSNTLQFWFKHRGEWKLTEICCRVLQVMLCYVLLRKSNGTRVSDKKMRGALAFHATDRSQSHYRHLKWSSSHGHVRTTESKLDGCSAVEQEATDVATGWSQCRNVLRCQQPSDAVLKHSCLWSTQFKES